MISFDRHRSRGQALVEFVLIAPLLFVLLGGIITLGIGVFYQQQLTNAAREAARFAAIHSATAQCPTTSWKEPNWSRLVLHPEINQVTYWCDPADLRWPEMTEHGRNAVWGLDRTAVHFARPRTSAKQHSIQASMTDRLRRRRKSLFLRSRMGRTTTGAGAACTRQPCCTRG